MQQWREARVPLNMSLRYRSVSNEASNVSGVPRDGPRAEPAQPFPAGVPGRRVQLVRHGDPARAPAALPRRLRGHAQVVPGAQDRPRARRGAVALARAARGARRRRAARALLPTAAAAPVTAPLPLSLMY